MKKVLSLVLTLVMLFSLFINTSAVGERSAPLTNPLVRIVETNGVRTATVSNETSTYTVTLDTLNNTICVSVTDHKTGAVTFGTTMSTIISPMATRGVSSTIHQDTYSNYEYDIYLGNPREWNLERPKDDGNGQYYFKVYENSSNEDELDVWFDAVNELNDQEIDAICDYGAALILAAIAGFLSGMSVASGGILTPTAVAAVIAAVGATGAAAVSIAQIATCCNECRLAIDDVYYATDNMHF